MKMSWEEISSLIKALEIVDSDPRRPLPAGYQNREALLKGLLEAQTPNGETALHIAAQNGNTDIIKTMLKSGLAKVDAQNKQGWTALHWAASAGHTETVNLLLNESPTLAVIQTNDGQTALHLATEYGHAGVVTALLRNPDPTLMHAKTTHNNDTALHTAVHYGQSSILEQLIKVGGPDLLNMKNTYGDTALNIAILDGKYPLVALLLNKGAIQDEASLPHALKKDHTDIALLLLGSEGAYLGNEQDKNGQTVLHWAAGKGDTRTVDAILKLDNKKLLLQVDEHGETALHMAARLGHTQVVASLLNAGGKALAEMSDAAGFTALHAAAACGRTEIVEQLLAVGGSELANIRSKNYGVALYRAYHAMLSVMHDKYLYWENPQFLYAEYARRDYDVFVNSLASITEHLFKYSGGKSLAATPLYNAKAGGHKFSSYYGPIQYLDLNNIPYTRDGYIKDPNKDRLLFNEQANLEVLFKDLAKESGVSDLSTTDKLYLYALAFECHAKRKLRAHDPDLTLLSRLIQGAPTEENKELVQNTLVTAIQRIQTTLHASARYKIGKLFKQGAPTLFDAIPDNIVPQTTNLTANVRGSINTTAPATERQSLLGGKNPTRYG